MKNSFISNAGGRFLLLSITAFAAGLTALLFLPTAKADTAVKLCQGLALLGVVDLLVSLIKPAKPTVETSVSESIAEEMHYELPDQEEVVEQSADVTKVLQELAEIKSGTAEVLRSQGHLAQGMASMINTLNTAIGTGTQNEQQ